MKAIQNFADKKIYIHWMKLSEHSNDLSIVFELSKEKFLKIFELVVTLA